LNGELSQPLEVRLAHMVALPQEDNERHFCRDPQRPYMALGQERLEAGEQGVAAQPLGLPLAALMLLVIVSRPT
jgi:hypothetical protein